ncbi:hypothetical protein C8R45DRAFT_945656 [Mycena sanguinolenta]|nr:hypothetical protein C8R45DRAFT_945656 [Mycena sanguinolenta]
MPVLPPSIDSQVINSGGTGISLFQPLSKAARTSTLLPPTLYRALTALPRPELISCTPDAPWGCLATRIVPVIGISIILAVLVTVPILVYFENRRVSAWMERRRRNGLGAAPVPPGVAIELQVPVGRRIELLSSRGEVVVFYHYVQSSRELPLRSRSSSMLRQIGTPEMALNECESPANCFGHVMVLLSDRARNWKVLDSWPVMTVLSISRVLTCQSFYRFCIAPAADIVDGQGVDAVGRGFDVQVVRR